MHHPDAAAGYLRLSLATSPYSFLSMRAREQLGPRSTRLGRQPIAPGIRRGSWRSPMSPRFGSVTWCLRCAASQWRRRGGHSIQCRAQELQLLSRCQTEAKHLFSILCDSSSLFFSFLFLFSLQSRATPPELKLRRQALQASAFPSLHALRQSHRRLRRSP